MINKHFVEKLSDYVLNNNDIININNYDIDGEAFYDKASKIRIDKNFFHRATQRGVEFESRNIPWLKEEIPTLNAMFHQMLDYKKEPFNQKEMLEFVMRLPSIKSKLPLFDIFKNAVATKMWVSKDNNSLITLDNVYAKLVYGLLCGFTREVSIFFVINSKIKEFFGNNVEIYSNKTLDGEFITDILLRDKNHTWAICVRIFYEDRSKKTNADKKLEKRHLSKWEVDVSDKYNFEHRPYRILQYRDGKSMTDSRILFVDINAEMPKDSNAIALVNKDSILPTLRLIYCLLNNREQMRNIPLIKK